MQLSELLSHLGLSLPADLSSLSIDQIACDSRKIKAGSLFVAIPGLKTEGDGFIREAFEQGAVAAISEKSSSPIPGFENHPIFQVPHARKALAKLSAIFSKEPTRNLITLGVTGTNGKTTITYLLEALLKEAGHSPAVLGTINYRHQNRVEGASHTTPESCDLQFFLDQVKKEGCDSVAMEVSSHAIDLHRVDDIHFDACLFTNLTPEHLDYHGDLETYFKAKQRLFTDLLMKSAKKHRAVILNIDDPFANSLLPKSEEIKALTFSLSPKAHAAIYPRTAKFSLDGIEAEIVTPWGTLFFHSPLLGPFNLSNLLAAIAVGGFLKIPIRRIAESLSRFHAVPGRLERVQNREGIHVFVDYAHTPDALKNVLSALRNLIHSSRPNEGMKGRQGNPPRLLTVCGCGGDRDKTKRPLMGEEVARHSDWAMITSDNPRTEDPQSILDQIVPGCIRQGWKPGKDFAIEIDRKKAIQRALNLAHPGDVVLIAGKGHEDYQIIGDKKFHFDDREVAKEFFKSR